MIQKPGSPFNHQPQPLQGLIAAPNEQQLNVLEACGGFDFESS